MTHRPPDSSLLDDTSANDDNSSSRRSFDSAASSGTTDGRWILRGVQWRLRLGVLPSSPASIDTLRRVTADGRRRYADLRRRLLVDPHLIDEAQKPAHLSMDNPLSLDPESVWGRYFRNAELERTIDKDLTRLYPEHGSFFQGATCQAMMRRILLVWSLMHPRHSYRQGMHELLAPLLYVLHVDVVHLAQVKHRYEDLFDDRFDGLPAHDSSIAHKESSARKLTYSELLFAKSLGVPEEDGHWVEKISAQDVLGALCQAEEGDTDLKAIVLGSDLYGAEGELGALLSARFVEHDAYCMFDALLSGPGGAVAMADYFSASSGVSPASGGVPPVLEASAALYRVLAAVDMPLYSHLFEFGVEPQFFALRWLRLLFGREFLLEDLLLLWDAIFSASNQPLSPEVEHGEESHVGVQYSPRSALISAVAVSMLLYIRPALLAAPDATGCLQRLLNFPRISDVKQLIDSAKALQPFAQAAMRTPPPHFSKGTRIFEHTRAGKHMRAGSVSPPLNHAHVGAVVNPLLRHQRAATCSPELLRMSIPESYWEEKWTSSVLQKVDEAVGSNGALDSTKQAVAGPLEESGPRLGSVPERLQQTADSPVRALSAPDVNLRQSVLSVREEAAPAALGDKDVSIEQNVGSSDTGSTRGALLQTTSDLRQWFMDDDSENDGWRPERALPVQSPGAPLPTTSKTGNSNTGVSSKGARDFFGPIDLTVPDAKGDNEAPAPLQGDVFREPSRGASAESSSPAQVHLIREDSPGNAFECSDNQLNASRSRVRDGGTTRPLLFSPSTYALATRKVDKRASEGKSQPQKRSEDLGGELFPHRQDVPARRFSLPARSSLFDEEEGSGPIGLGEEESYSVGVDLVEGNASSSSLKSPQSQGLSDAPSGSDDPEDKVRAQSAPLKGRKLNFLWNLGNGSGEKAASSTKALKGDGAGNSPDPNSTNVPNEVTRRPKRWWRSHSDVTSFVAPEPEKTGHISDQENKTGKSAGSAEALTGSPDLARRPKEKGYSGSSQVLGQSLLEHLQVIEEALLQENAGTSKEAQVQHPPGRKKGHVAALIALAEMRKIATALQQA